MAQTFRGSVCALDASDPHHVFNVFGGLGSSPRPQHQVFDLAFGFLSFANTVDELKRIVTGFLTTSSAITVNQRCLSPVTTENLHVPNPDQRRPTILADHVLAAAAYDGSIVEYATANSLKTKDLYQWKTALTKRGFLPLEKAEPATDFAETIARLLVGLRT